jgi:polyvinyl alcohol dehydrogenase (cytochrome)
MINQAMLDRAMRITVRSLAGVIVSSLSALGAHAQGQTGAMAQTDAMHPGRAIYERACGTCHNNPEATRSPSFDTLRKMRTETITYALTQGKMQAQGATLSPADRSVLVSYLAGGDATADDWITASMCAPNDRKVKLAAAATVSGFGFDKANHRNLSAAQAGIAREDFANLELAWSMAFPKATAMRAQPAIVGSMLFYPVADASKLFAIETAGAKPCLKWVYNNEEPLRTSVSYGELPGSKRKVLVFADLASNVHLVDALTGARIWKQPVNLNAHGLTTGTPVLHDNRIYAPISQYEIMVGADEKHECCKSHGAVSALDAATGKVIWTAHTMPDAKPVRDRGDGQMIWGPSGAPIWNSPVLDLERGQLYVGTGEATSEPAAPTTDAILAISLKDGAIKWSHQATANDIFLSGCGPRSKSLNCSKDTVYRDVDFGASLILAKKSDGSDVILAGQKSGTLWAIDPGKGTVVWRQDFGEGSPLGGIHWGITTDGERVFAPINRPYGFSAPAGAATQKPGMHAVKIDTGEVLWTFVAEADCSGDRKERMRGCANNVGLSAAPAVIDGAVVAGGMDGFLRAFDAKTGEVLWKYDTARSYDSTWNGVAGVGGSIDAAAIAAGNGYLFVNSGYGMFGGAPGNVLLAFKVKKK